MINQNYDFVNNVPEDVQSAFLDFQYTVVVVPAGTELWKLSSFGLPLGGDPGRGYGAVPVRGDRLHEPARQ